jgi:gliding motility-associated lipoprotein GldH
MIKKPGRILIAIPVMVILFISQACDSRRIFDENSEIPEGIWDKNKIIQFSVNVTDTISTHNIYINVRNASGYPFSNLYLFITTHSPKGGVLHDTVELTLADEKGKWFGNGLGDLWDNQIPYKMNVKFPNKGIYHFEYVQGMRNLKLPCIMDVGLRVERTK